MRARRRWLSRLMMCGVLIAMAGCAYPVRNEPLLQPIRHDLGYRGQQVDDGPLPNTLVVMTISGGGTRASALGYGAMLALRDVQLGGDGPNLLEAVDIISSVSGGSVPAAYLALRGPDGIDDFRRAFLLRDGMAALLWHGLNPVGLASLSTPAVERIDLLIDHLDGTLFDGATYAALRHPDDPLRWRRPYLIVNAADMVAEAPFPFHQHQFDLLCSDLEQIPLSVAVAASAAFPVALSPVTLHNYSEPEGRPVQRDAQYPPFWTEQAEQGTSIYENADRVHRARRGAGYLETEGGVPVRQFIHLLDGGIADNLGLREPIRLMGTSEIEPSFLTFMGRPDGIQEVLVVVVNARSDPQSRLDREIATPGPIDMLTASISSAIDNATFGTLSDLRGIIVALIQAAGECTPQPEGDCPLHISTVPIDFDYITNPRCRALFKEIATSWTLSDGEVDALIDLAGALLWKSQDFRDFVGRQGGGSTVPIASQDAAAAETAACGVLARAESESG